MLKFLRKTALSSGLLRLVNGSLAALCAAALLASPALAVPAVGSTLAPLTLSGATGGRVDGAAWSSATLKDKVWLIFYVAPGHRDDNQELKDSLAAQAFPPAKYGSVAIINMAASWLPNSVLASALKSNQEKYPQVTYVKDMEKAVVKQWHLPDDAFAMVLVDQKGQVLMAKEGDLTKTEIASTIALIKQHLDQKS